MPNHLISADKNAMSAIEYASRTTRWAKLLEDLVQSETGLPLPEARKIVARETGIAPGTLENIRRERVKGIAGWAAERLRAFLIRKITLKIEALSHELQLAKASGMDPRGNDLIALEAAIQKGRELLEEGIKN